MAASIINTIGIALVTIGTVFTLWTILRANPQEAWTWGEMGEKHNEFPKEQGKTRIGYILIVLGGILQIVGQWI